MTTENLKILLTGVTGYIGGSALAEILASPHPKLRSAYVTVPLRDSDGSRSAKITNAYGERVTPVHLADLSDTTRLEELAAEHDIVINTAMVFDPKVGEAMAQGLSKRKSAAGAPKPFIIHTSGTSNLSDFPLSGTAHPEREFDDAQGAATYEWEVAAEREKAYGQRTMELAMIQAGLEAGVKTLVIMSPTIYGVGTGLFNRHSLQIPYLMQYVLKRGEGVLLGKGAGVWDNVHIEDLATLYTLVVTSYLDDASKVPTNKEGVIFSGTRRHAWKDIFQGVAEVLHSKGAIASSALRELTLEQGADIFGGAETTEAGLASNSKTVASIGKRLGWQPRHGEESWKRGFEEEAEEILAKQKSQA